MNKQELQKLREQIREIAKEEANAAMCEHLDDYEHTEKKVQVELYQ